MIPVLNHKISQLVSRFLNDEKGFAAIMTAVLLPAIILMAGLGTEAGYWYFTQRKIQNAADTAAYASIVNLISGNTATITSTAETVAKINGYLPLTSSISVNHPPTSGIYTGDTDAIEVIITQTVPRYLSALLSQDNVTIKSRAIAKLEARRLACMLSLNDDASGAVTFSGSSKTVLDGCNMVVNSVAADAILVEKTATVSLDCASTSGGATTTNGLILKDCNSISQYQPQSADPFVALEQITTPVECSDMAEFKVTKHSGIGYPDPKSRYCGGFNLNAGAEVELSSGYYIFDGGNIVINANAKFTGENVVLFLTGGATLTFNGGATIQLSAPKTGIYEGILVFGDRDDNVTHKINGNSSSNYNGAIYTSGAHLLYNGSSSIKGGCVQLVSDTIRIDGNTTLNADCTGSPYSSTMIADSAKLVL